MTNIHSYNIVKVQANVNNLMTTFNMSPDISIKRFNKIPRGLAAAMGLVSVLIVEVSWWCAGSGVDAGELLLTPLPILYVTSCP